MGQGVPLGNAHLWVAAFWLTASSGVSAEWLNLCPTEDAATTAPDYLTHAVRDDLRIDRVGVTDRPAHGANCIGREVPFARADVQWARALTVNHEVFDAELVVLQGRQVENGFRVSEWIVPSSAKAADPPVRRVAAPGSDLLPSLDATVFGEEGRAQVTREAGRITLRCEAGTKPAGLLLQSSVSLPRHASTRMHLHASGQGRFTVGYSTHRQAGGDPTPLRDIVLAPGDEDRLVFALPDDAGTRADWHSLTLGCPPQTARLEFDQLRLASAQTRGHARARAAWFWSSDVWRSRAEWIFSQQASWRLDRVYIGVDLNDAGIADAEALSAFVTQAHARGLSVWVVFGDPAAVHAGEVPRYQTYVAQVGEYNLRVEKNARLDGIQLDIEPYLDPGLAGSTETWKHLYRPAVAKIAVGSPLPVELVLPFWLRDDEKFLDALAPAIGGLVVMDYRTDPSAIAEMAVPFLEWGGRHNKPVTIALETLPFAPETKKYFGRAGKGELLALRLGNRTLLALLNKPIHWPEARIFQWRADRSATFDQVSFAGQETVLRALLPHLETELGAWSSFAGIALHGLDRSP
jgi:hypothetical protein